MVCVIPYSCFMCAFLWWTVSYKYFSRTGKVVYTYWCSTKCPTLVSAASPSFYSSSGTTMASPLRKKPRSDRVGSCIKCAMNCHRLLALCNEQLSFHLRSRWQLGLVTPCAGTCIILLLAMCCRRSALVEPGCHTWEHRGLGPLGVG